MGDKLAIAAVFSSVMMVLLSYLAFTGFLTARPQGDEPDEEDPAAVAACLAAKNATLYMSQYCGACVQQKALFGDAFGLIPNVIDCAADRDACARAGVDAVPTWVMNGKKYGGVQTLVQLAEAAGCA